MYSWIFLSFIFDSSKQKSELLQKQLRTAIYNTKRVCSYFLVLFNGIARRLWDVCPFLRYLLSCGCEVSSNKRTNILYLLDNAHAKPVMVLFDSIERVAFRTLRLFNVGISIKKIMKCFWLIFLLYTTCRLIVFNDGWKRIAGSSWKYPCALLSYTWTWERNVISLQDLEPHH